MSGAVGSSRTKPAQSRWDRFLAERAPWTDKRGRFGTLRATVFALLLLPGAWLAYRWGAGLLGARPLNAMIHGTGYWAVWILLASLMVSPAKALLGMPNLVVVRRQIGNAAAAYAGIHLTLYAADQNWRPVAIVSDIRLRLFRL